MLQTKIEAINSSIDHVSEDKIDEFTSVTAKELEAHQASLHELEEVIISMDLSEHHELFAVHARIDKLRLDCRHRCETLKPRPQPRDTTSDMTGDTCKLKKLDVPTFSGNVMDWEQFWSHFKKAVHERRGLKYLNRSLLDPVSKDAISAFSDSQYDNAVKCLVDRYHRPREVIAQHSYTLIEFPPVKEGDVKDLRNLHATWTQHIRALAELGHIIDSAFLTSILERKLGKETRAKWKWESRSHVLEVPKVEDLLQLIHDQAMSMESEGQERKYNSAIGTGKKLRQAPKFVHSFVGNANPAFGRCILCPEERHPLFACDTFRSKSQEEKKSTLRQHNACFNCLRTGHSASKCNYSYRCKKCQRLHHTLIHQDPVAKTGNRQNDDASTTALPAETTAANSAATFGLSTLYMTCRIQVIAPEGSIAMARAMIDTVAASFITERLGRTLHLPRNREAIQICGIGGLHADHSPTTSVTFKVAPVVWEGKTLSIKALVLPRVTRDLPTQFIQKQKAWTHLIGLTLADPTFTQPGRIDVILGNEHFQDVMRHGRRDGPPGSPTACETEFGWVIGGAAMGKQSTETTVAVYHAIAEPNLDVLRMFYELEEVPGKKEILTVEERTVVRHFQERHRRTTEGRFIVPLPKKPDAPHIGESRTQAVRRLCNLERSLNAHKSFTKVDEVIQDYLDLGHAEKVQRHMHPPLTTCPSMSSTSSRAPRPRSGQCSMHQQNRLQEHTLNDTLLVGPMVHPPLIDVLMRFRKHPVAVTADVSKMYRAVELDPLDRDMHRFVWRSNLEHPIMDYRMTRVTFGVAASCFAANMSVKQNALDNELRYPLAFRAIMEFFYVDDGLTGARDVELAIRLREELQTLFDQGGFHLRKLNSNRPLVLQTVPSELRDSEEVLRSVSLPKSIAMPTPWTLTGMPNQTPSSSISPRHRRMPSSPRGDCSQIFQGI